MFETKSHYKEFSPLASAVLKEQGRNNLVSLLEQPKIKNLFLHNVDHPMGYQDGPSGVSLLRLDRRTKNLTEKDRNKLYEISERTIRVIENNKENLSPKEKSTLLLGANQLTQNAVWKTRSPVWKNKIRANLIERISKSYIDNSEQIERVKEWDAQIAENKSFYHVAPTEMTAMGSMFSIIPTVIGAAVFKDSSFSDFVINSAVPISLCSAGISYFGHQFALLAQEMPGEKKSPNTAKKLQTKRHYRFQRHPLYFWKGMMSVVPGLISINPLGLFFASKGAYQISKTCEFQDERMRILYGKEAKEYQNRTPAFIPGSKILLKGLEKILPKKVTNILDSPISKYLEKIPYIKSEKYTKAECSNEDKYHKGEPTFHIGSNLERMAYQANPLKELAEIPVDIVKAGKIVYDWGARKVRKKWKQRQRRVAWEKLNQLKEKQSYQI